MLVEEILAPSTAAIDRPAKTALYARFGIPEYWIVDPDSLGVDAYTLTERTYVSIVDDGAGQVRSRVFPGLVVTADPVFGCSGKSWDMKAFHGAWRKQRTVTRALQPFHATR